MREVKKLKFDITQQQVFTSIVTLFLLSVAGCWALCSGYHSPVAFPTNVSLLGGWISSFQLQHPLWSSILTSALIFFSSIRLGHIVSILNLYATATSIQLPIIGMLMWCVTLGEDYLVSALITSVSAYYLGRLMLAARSNTYLGHIFDISFFISLLPLLYAPSVMLWLSALLILVQMGMTLREWLISLVGFLLSLVVTSYIFWLCGYDFLYAAQQFQDQLFGYSNVLSFNTLLLFRAIFFLIALLLALISVVWVGESIPKNKIRLSMCLTLIFTLPATYLLPSANMLTFSLVAPAVAVMSSFAIAHLRGLAANIIYFALLLLLLLAMFTPQYLPFDELIRALK
ncbi:MAG: hypothetical protein SNH94_04600 [Rikenellaceae bacterium]